MTFDPAAHEARTTAAASASPFEHVRRFRPVMVRGRHDGWSAERQADFITALGESGCIVDACAAVGMSRESAYRLRGRPEAAGFRLAWQAALDYAVQRLEDALLSRAINGVAVPHFYQGEQVGEHRRYDERLAMFLLRYRRPLTYARHWDTQAVVAGNHEDEAERFAAGVHVVRHDVAGEQIAAEDAAYWTDRADRTKNRTETDRAMDRVAAAKARRAAGSTSEWTEADAAAAEAATRATEAATAAKLRSLAAMATARTGLGRGSDAAGDPAAGDRATPGVARPLSTSAGGDAVPGAGERLSQRGIGRRAARRRKARAARQRTPAAGRP